MLKFQLHTCVKSDYFAYFSQNCILKYSERRSVSGNPTTFFKTSKQEELQKNVKPDHLLTMFFGGRWRGHIFKVNFMLTCTAVLKQD